MGLFSGIKRLFVKHNSGVITDEMREKSLELRRMQARINSLEKQVELKAHLEGLQDIINGGKEESSDMEKLILPLFLKALIPQQQGQQEIQFPVNPLSTRNSEGVTSPDRNLALARQIKGFVTPEIQKTLSELSDADLADIRQRLL